MTLEEVRREIAKDYPILFRKSFYVCRKLEKSLSKVAKGKGFVAFYDYCSKYKNNWMYRIEITKKRSGVSSMLIYHNGKGNVGITVTDGTEGVVIIYHTGHFFNRYNERLKLNLQSRDEIIRSYMNQMCDYGFEELEEIEPGVKKIFCKITSGILLGTYNSKLKFMKANTFLSLDMLRGNQIELHNEIMNDELNKYANTSGKLD